MKKQPILVRPEIHKALKMKALIEGITMFELTDRIFVEYIDNNCEKVVLTENDNDDLEPIKPLEV